MLKKNHGWVISRNLTSHKRWVQGCWFSVWALPFPPTGSKSINIICLILLAIWRLLNSQNLSLFPCSTLDKWGIFFLFILACWLFSDYYSGASESMLCCFHCMAFRDHLLVTKRINEADTWVGLSNWIEAWEAFERHQDSCCHHKTVEILWKTTKNVSGMFNFQYSQKTEENKKILMNILCRICDCARQRFVLWGHSTEQAKNKSLYGDIDYNFIDPFCL